MMMVWGIQNVGLLVDTRYLTPGYGAVSADLTAIGFRATDEYAAGAMRVKHCTLTLDNDPIDYILRVNGEDTALKVSLAPNASEGQNLTDEVDLAPGDLIELVAVKTGILVSGLVNALVSMEIR